MTSNFLCLSFSTLFSSSSYHHFAKLNVPPPLKQSPVSIAPPPPPSKCVSNKFEIYNSPRGLISGFMVNFIKKRASLKSYEFWCIDS